MRADLKWAGLGALAVAAAVAVVAAGACLGAPGDAGGGSEPAPEAAPARSIDIVGADGVAALAGDDGAFAEALAGYLAAAGEEARAATVVADPSDPSDPAFFASAGGLWYSCEATGGASGWAFSSLGAESPVAMGRLSVPEPAEATAPQVGPAPPEPPQGEQGANAAAAEWVPIADNRAVAAAIGAGPAGKLAEALSGYAASKGLAFDAATSRLDAASVRPEGAQIGFVVDIGSATLDVLYGDGAFGFLVL